MQTAIINKSRFIERLQQIAKSPGLIELREAITHVENSLKSFHDDKEGFLNVSDNGDTARVEHVFLTGGFTQIRKAASLERAVYYVERMAKGIESVRTSAINDINLNRWQEYPDILTDSLWVMPKRDSSGHHSAWYWGNFIPQIPNQMIRRYTKPGEWVLDPMVGVNLNRSCGRR